MESVALTQVCVCLCKKRTDELMGVYVYKVFVIQDLFAPFFYQSFSSLVGFEICDMQKHKCALAHTRHKHTRVQSVISLLLITRSNCE